MYFPGRKEIAQLLIDRGANMYLQDDSNETPLQKALHYGTFEYSGVDRANLKFISFVDYILR